MKTKITLILLLAMGLSLQAYAENIEKGTCHVGDENDRPSSGKTTIEEVLVQATLENAKNRFCTAEVIVDVPRINFEQILSLTIPGTSSSSVFTLKGSDPAKPTVFDFSGLSNSADPMQYCAFTIWSSYIKLENIVINAPKDSGICVVGLEEDGTLGPEVSNIEFNNVHIDKAGGHGFIIRDNAKDILFSSDSSIQNVAGNAIKILGNTVSDDLIRIDATDGREFVQEGPDINGLAVLAVLDEAGDGAKAFSMSKVGSDQLFVFSEGATKITDVTVERVGRSDKYRVEGKIAGGPVLRIQVYSGDSPGAFYTYVLPQATGSGGNGINKDADGFKFKIDASKVGSSIVLVPEIAQNTIGNSTPRLILVGEGGVGGGGDGDATPSSDELDVTGARPKLVSITACLEARGAGAPGQLADPVGLDEDFDSDGDGLPDVYEDSNGDCQPQETDYSDWTDPDTDDDGIPDGVETRGAVPFSTYAETILGIARPADSKYQFCPLVDDKDPCNADMETEKANDAQALSNARDPDSDEDGLKDFQEDRQLTLNPWKSAILVDPDGNSRPCSLGAENTTGIKWDVYRWTPGSATPPQETDKHTFQYAVPDGMVLVPLACKNKAVPDNAFKGSGIYSELYNPDTDADGRCDGSGAGCPDGSAVNDKCPRDPRPDNECSTECNRHEDLYRIRRSEESRAVLEFDPNDSEEPIGLKIENNKAVLFEKGCVNGSTYCDDLDGDSIPDCFERMNVDCNPAAQSQLALNPHSADTDGDGFNDNVDINPFQPSQSNEITDANRDQLRTIFATSQIKDIITCYIDRDNDGLYDILEDRNNDFRFSAVSVSWEEFKGLRDSQDKTDDVESDPLNPDSDKDALGDQAEFRVGTNPQAKDTDGDGLYDRTELKGDLPDSYEGAQPPGCFIKIDDLDSANRRAETEPEIRTGTDPANPDMDLDQLSDGVEVIGKYTTTRTEIGGNILDGGFTEDIDMVSNPFRQDSDGDGKTDAQEYAKLDLQDVAGLAPDGKMQYFESSPCDPDTDGDGINDSQDPCPTSGDIKCRVMRATGSDADGDALPDALEEKDVDSDGDGIMNVNDPDSDNDGLLDGEEDDNRNGVEDPTDHNGQEDSGETDRLDPDSDKDELKDGDEVKILKTNPLSDDSDSDCIDDGKEVHFNSQSSFTGTDTDPRNPDTDGDGLCDGNNALTNGGYGDFAGTVSCYRGEDLDCNGEQTKCENNPDRFCESDSKNADSDGDGITDLDEARYGGRINIEANRNRMLYEGPGQGCFSVTGASPTDPNSMLVIFGVLMIANRLFARRLKRRTKN